MKVREGDMEWLRDYQAIPVVRRIGEEVEDVWREGRCRSYSGLAENMTAVKRTII